MKAIRKQLMSLMLALTMVMMCAVPAFAVGIPEEEFNVTATNAYSSIMPRDSGPLIRKSGTTFTSERKEWMMTAYSNNVRLTCTASVSEPCSMYLIIYKPNGSILGIKTITFVRDPNNPNKGLSINSSPLNPSSFAANGDYTLGYYFDRSGVNYSFTINGTW